MIWFVNCIMCNVCRSIWIQIRSYAARSTYHQTHHHQVNLLKLPRALKKEYFFLFVYILYNSLVLHVTLEYEIYVTIKVRKWVFIVCNTYLPLHVMYVWWVRVSSIKINSYTQRLFNVWIEIILFVWVTLRNIIYRSIWHTPTKF